jgi:carboxyl-terminal processing protease
MATRNFTRRQLSGYPVSHSIIFLSFLLALTFNSGVGHCQMLLPTLLRNDSITLINPILKGAWKSIGNSYLLQADSTGISLYSTTSQHCYREKNDYLSELLNNTAKFSLNRTLDTLSVFLQDFGEKTKQLQSENKYYRLRELPGYCGTLTDQQKDDPEFLFELFWLTLSENYANSYERNLDWNQIYLDYRPRISKQSTTADVFEVMGEIVTLTKDQHTRITSQDGETRQYRGEPTSRLLKESFDQQKNINNFDHYISEFFYTNYQNISNDLLMGKGKKVANGKIEWGDLTPSIGYIHVHAMARYTLNELSRRQHIDTLDFYMEQIMKSFQTKKAILVDVSFNFGGYDAAGLTISSYFTDKPVPAYTSYKFQEGQYLKGSLFTINPSKKYTFTKPVYVLTTDITRSAAESFAIQMKSLPHVKLIGTNTLGILSNGLNKSIGDFWLALSNEKYLTPKGNMYEVTGVDVDIKLEVFTKDNMFNGHRDAVRKIVEIIEEELR